MEYLDICDEIGNLTGEKKLKDLVHKDGDWHKIAIIWLVNNKGEFLLQKRSSASISKPDTWDVTVAGHIKSGEDPAQAAVRELAEEIGIESDCQELKFICSYKNQTLENNKTFINNQHTHLFLLNKDVKAEEIIVERSEVSEIRYFTAEEIEQHLENNTMNFAFDKNQYNNYYKGLKDKVL